jgi:GNAT superfamily N-acetyltransferase
VKQTEIKHQPLTEIHLSEMMAIQQICFQETYCESLFVYATLLNVFPDGAWGAFHRDRLIGYIFFHPYKTQTVKPLDSGLLLTGEEDCMYLHEIALLPDYRSQGIPRLLLNVFDDHSARYRMDRQSLVSVQNSRPFWEKKGFSIVRKINEGGYIDGVLMEKRC